MLASLVCFLLDCKTFICQPLTTMSQTLQLSVACCHQKQQHIIPRAIKTPALQAVTLRTESEWMDGWMDGHLDRWLIRGGKYIYVTSQKPSPRRGSRIGEGSLGRWGAQRGPAGGPGDSVGVQHSADPRKAAQCSAGAERGEWGPQRRDTQPPPPHVYLSPKPAESRAAALPSVTNAFRLRVLMSINV